jgi:uncharacterized protein YdcH (DUF465 family)
LCFCLQSRTRGRKENGNVVVVKRVRGRTRASTTTTEQPERSSETVTRRSAPLRTRAPYTRSTNRERASDNNNEESNTPRVSLILKVKLFNTLYKIGFFILLNSQDSVFVRILDDSNWIHKKVNGQHQNSTKIRSNLSMSKEKISMKLMMNKKL